MEQLWNAGRVAVRWTFFSVGILAAFLALVSAAQAQPGRDRWERLGCVDVGRQADRDIIQVGRREGRFKAIILEVSGNDVHIDRLRVVYANGQPDDLPVRSEIREGSRSRPIDLQGRERSIDRIEIVSQRGYTGRGRGRAQICVAGLTDDGAMRPPGPPGPQGGRWEQLGCHQVGMMQDRDTIRVGRREGRFRAIRLEVQGSDVHVENVTVVYANGEPDRIAVRSFIRQGSQTGPLELRGQQRAIDRIEMVYRSVPSFRGQATVCVSGFG